ncbi:substrate-binding domain-containing protein [Jannaschia pohangensis]|nr:substrate-binding domain-containing protein [Jannaschia pohangensis]
MLTIIPQVVPADVVTVSSKDNAVSITGELLSFDDDTVTLSTEIGELRLDRASINCEGAACPRAVTGFSMQVAVTDPTLTPLLQFMMDDFARSKGLVAVSVPDSEGGLDRIEILAEEGSALDVMPYGPADGFAALIEGRVDLALTSNAVPAAMADGYAASGKTDLRDPRRERVIALDAIVPVVHPSNTIRSLTIEEIALIAAGRIANWAELGGDDAPIRMILPAEGSALDITLSELVLEPNRIRLRRSAERSADGQAALAAVKEDPNAITITGMSETAGTNAVPIRQVCGPLAHATDFTVKAEEYPLSHRILGYTGADAYQGNEGEFLSYMVSPEAQGLITKAGLVDQTIVAKPVGEQGTRMTSAILTAGNGTGLGLVQDFTRDLATADRLSTTFRFTSGSVRLDTKSLDDVERMVDFLISPEARLREILIIGFTDDVGRFDLNTRLALQRATNVRDALLSATGGDTLAGRVQVSSYGPLAPVGCNETAEGRDSNRRVEIWLR